MSQNSENSKLDPVRLQMDGVHDSAAELIRQSGSAEANGSRLENQESEQENRPSESELISWLKESDENRKAYESVREFDRNLANALSDVAEFEPGLEERIRCLVQSGEFDEVSNDDLTEEEEDYQVLFDSSGEDHSAQDGESGSPKVELKQRDDKSVATSKPNRRAAAWWMGTIGTLATTAAIVMVAFLVQSDPAQPTVDYTAEMLCSESLNWNPNRVAGEWNSDLSQAPVNRAFPGHLIRLQARSWKKMEIEGDQQGIVYNLIPDGNLAERKAFLYVFQSDRDFQLPGQFASHATSNRKYKFWSVACRQDLVFVLVYEGDEKRLHDLIKIQQVG